MTADDRAVSPVVGISVLVGIVVVLAALLGTLALGFDDRLEGPGPYAGYETAYDPSGAGNGGVPYVNFTHTSGRIGQGAEVYVVDSDGNRVAWEDVWTGGSTIEAGSYVHIDGKGSDCALNEVRQGEVYRIVWDGDDIEYVLSEYEVQSPPDSTPGPYTC